MARVKRDEAFEDCVCTVLDLLEDDMHLDADYRIEVLQEALKASIQRQQRDADEQSAPAVEQALRNRVAALESENASLVRCVIKAVERAR